jgi:hypothetical protein
VSWACTHTFKFRLRRMIYLCGRGIGALFIGLDECRGKISRRASFVWCDILVAGIRTHASHLVTRFMSGARRAASCGAKGRAYWHSQQSEHGHKRKRNCGYGVRSNRNHLVPSIAFTLADQFRSIGYVAAFAEKPASQALPPWYHRRWCRFTILSALQRDGGTGYAGTLCCCSRGENGGAGEVRTRDNRFRKPMLYPSELQPRSFLL